MTSGLHSPARPVLVQLSFSARGWEGKHSGGGQQKRQRERKWVASSLLPGDNMTQRRPPPSPSSSSHRSLFNTNSQAPSVIALYSPTRSLPPRSLKRENPLHDWATSTGKKSLFFFCFPLNQGFCVLMQNSPFSFFKSPPWSFHPKVNSAWQLVTCFKCL